MMDDGSTLARHFADCLRACPNGAGPIDKCGVRCESEYVVARGRDDVYDVAHLIGSAARGPWCEPWCQIGGTNMGQSSGTYKAEFPAGTTVTVASLDNLKEFIDNSRLHHPLQPFQLDFAGRIATVESVVFYHGGDELYQLLDIPGIWHEQNLIAKRTP